MLPLNITVNVVSSISQSGVPYQQPSRLHLRHQNSSQLQQSYSPPGKQPLTTTRPQMSQAFYPHLTTVTTTATVAYDTDIRGDVPVSYQPMMSVMSDQATSLNSHQKITSVPVVTQAVPYPSSGTLGSDSVVDVPSRFAVSSASLSTPPDLERDTGYAVYNQSIDAEGEDSRYFAPGLLVGVASTLGYGQEDTDNVVNDFCETDRRSGYGHRQEAGHYGQTSCGLVADSEFNETFYPSDPNGWHEFGSYGQGRGVEQWEYNEQPEVHYEYQEHAAGMGHSLFSNTDTSSASFSSFQIRRASKDLESLCPDKQHFLTCSDQQSANALSLEAKQSVQNTLYAGNPFYEAFPHDSGRWCGETNVGELVRQQLYASPASFQDNQGEVNSDKDMVSPGIRTTNKGNDRPKSQNGPAFSTSQKHDDTNRMDVPYGESAHTTSESLKQSGNKKIPKSDGHQQIDQIAGDNLHTIPTASTDIDPAFESQLLQYQQHRIYPQFQPAPLQRPGDQICGTSNAVSDSQPSFVNDNELFALHRAPPCPSLLQCQRQDLVPSRASHPPGFKAQPEIPPGTPSLVKSSDSKLISSDGTTHLASSPTQGGLCQTNTTPATTVRSRVSSAENCGGGASLDTSCDDSSSPSSTTTSLIDVDHLLSSGVTVAGFKPRPIIRKRRKVMVPTTEKSTNYWHKRKKNNDSAKRSREAKKEKEKNFYRRALELEYENFFLKERLGQVEAQLHAVSGTVAAQHDPAAPTPHGCLTVGVQPDPVFT